MNEQPSEGLLLVAELAEVGLSAATLVHELRQPLFAIKALAQLGQAGGRLEGERLADLVAATRHLEGLLDAWRSVGRKEPPQLYALETVVLDVLRLLDGRARQASASLHFEEGSAWVYGSPSVARQILLNLVQNSLDAVRSRPRRDISISILRTGQRVGLRVADTGPGLPEDVAFVDPFVTTKGSAGTGLGLYITRALCEANGGTLTFRSSGEGAEVSALFVTPREPAAAP